jgi:hypothetical protein
MALEVWKHRGGLRRTRQALAAGSVRLGFVGGSITDARPGNNWPEPVVAWFVETFPTARIQVENAGIGATGSDLAVFRAERDLVGRGCDLVFVEFAVNDGGEPTEKRNRTREGLLRKLLAGDGRDVVLAYTFGQGSYAEMIQGRVPATIAEFETLADHYNLGSVWMGLYALDELQKGRMRWEEWLPDGVHPQSRGSLSYGQSVAAFLERELQTAPSDSAIRGGKNLPLPRNPRCWEKTENLAFSQVKLEGAWSIRRWTNLVWMDEVLCTAAPGATLSFSFRGCGLALGFDFGKTSAEFRWRLDGGGWTASKRERPDWCGASGWYRLSVLAEDLPDQEHTCEIEVIHGDAAGCTGTNFHLALIGVVS